MSDTTTADTSATETTSKPTFDPTPWLARELGLPERGVRAVVKLLAEGATVPVHRALPQGGHGRPRRGADPRHRGAHGYVLELEERRAAILEEIGKQGKLTPELEKKLRACPTKAELEDLYLPYKPKRRTRAMIAKERGLEPLAERILAQPRGRSPRARRRPSSTGEGGPDRRGKEALARARATSSPSASPRRRGARVVREAFEGGRAR
jgi:uncharacterized protein